MKIHQKNVKKNRIKLNERITDSAEMKLFFLSDTQKWTDFLFE